MHLDPNRLANLVVPLTRFFYALLAVSLLSVLFGAPASGFFFLIVAALAQVLRASIQESLLQRPRGDGGRGAGRPGRTSRA